MRSLIIIALITVSTLVHGQYAINLGITSSPARSISHQIGYTKISVHYSSPSVKSRKIWGELEQYNEVWRAGANYATTIEFSENVTIDDITINKGAYSFFIIPQKEEAWTLILNSVDRQWGAFSYDESKDIIRIKSQPKIIPHQEHLNYDIASKNGKEGEVVLRWEQIEVGFNFRTSLKDALANKLRENISTSTAATKWVNYLQAAEILYNENDDLKTSLKWIEMAEEFSTVKMEWNPQFYPKDYILAHLYWTKAKILAKLEDFKKAHGYAIKMKSIDNKMFYDKKKNREDIDNLIQSWSIKK